MNKNEAMPLALGYAYGREDGTGTRTVSPDPHLSGYFTFAEAFAQGWDDFTAQRRNTMIPVRDAWEHWQESGGRSVFARGDLTLPDDQRAELRGLWPTFWTGNHDTTAYYARQREFQDAIWDAAAPAEPVTGHPGLGTSLPA